VNRASVGDVDRLAVRARPAGWPIRYQSWGKLLFLHWPVPADLLRPLVPEPLAIDTFEGTAWVGITPFTMWGVRPVFSPSLPFLSESHEPNARTYVYLDGIPGIWVFSLDANNTIAVWGARLAFHLPYFNARMSLEQRDRTVYFASRRTHRGAAPAEFEAVWSVGERLPQSEPGSLTFLPNGTFSILLTKVPFIGLESYPPWPLHQARLLSCRSSMIESQGLPSPAWDDPLLYQQGKPLRVRVWPRVSIR
jgi:uncharacterized protein